MCIWHFKTHVRETPCHNENIKRVFQCFEPLFALNQNAVGRGPLPTQFAAYLRCCGPPQDPFLKQIAFLRELNTKLFSLCDAFLDVEKCNCIYSDVKSVEIENEECSTVEEVEGSAGRILERSDAGGGRSDLDEHVDKNRRVGDHNLQGNDTTVEHVLYAAVRS